MAHLNVSPNCAFGLRSEIRHGVHFLEDSTILFPAGHHIVLHHLESRAQRFIPGLVESHGITAIAVTNHKRQLAVAEKSDNAPIIIYDLQTLKRRKVLVSVETGSKEVTYLSFSPDGKLLASLGGSPESILAIWSWEKARLVASVKTGLDPSSALRQCAFAGSNGASIAVLGSRFFKQFRLTESSLKLQPHILTKQENCDYRCIQWIEDRLLVGCGNGLLLCCEGSEIVWSHNLDPQESIESISKTTHGIVVGTDGGRLIFFESDSKETYTLNKEARIHREGVADIILSPNGEQLLCTTADVQVLLLSTASVEMTAEMRHVDPAFALFHHGAILGLSTCLRKQLIATSGSDKSIRLWNYFTKCAELVKFFPEECFSVSLHPSGTLIVAGFADKLRLMTVLMDDFKLVKEFSVRACRECKFANGGHHFAAVAGNTIFVYATYTCEVVATLRGHNGKASSLFWSSDDLSLISAGLDGAIYEWSIKEQKRVKENVLKGCNYSCVIATANFSNILAVGSDMKLKELEDIQGGGTQITKDVSTNMQLTQLALHSNERMLFVATQTGTVRTYKYPINGDFHEYKCQSGAITRMALAADSRLLAVASEDGSLYVMDIRDNDLASKLRKDQLSLPWAEEVLVSKAELDEKQQRMVELETRVNEITMQTEYQLRLKDLDLQEKLKAQSDGHEAELQSERRKLDLLSQEKNEMELEYEEKLRASQEKTHQQLNALDSQYQQKILSEVERYQQLLQEKETLNKRWDEQNALLAEAHETTIRELTEEYEHKLREEHLNGDRLVADKESLEEEFEEIKKQLEADADQEVDELKHRYEKKLSEEREIGLRLKGQNGIMRKKFSALQNDIEAQKEEIKSLFEQKRDLYDTIASLEKDILGLKKAVKERDETISDKERRIFDFKKKNQELEKFKFVLDYKIKELKSLIDPKDEEIEQYKEQVNEMDQELQQYHEANAALDLTISNLRLKQNGLTQQLKKERRLGERAKMEVESLTGELEEVVQSIQHPKELKRKIIEMYRRHEQGRICAALDQTDAHDEFERQRVHLEKTVQGLKFKAERDAQVHRTGLIRLMQENSELIKEINSLRKRVHSTSSSPQQQCPTTSQTVDRNSQHALIEQLQSDLLDKQSRIQQLEQSVKSRPVSRERLPPVSK